MLPTPSTTHINPSLIYPPAEDSYLLLDTLSSASEIQFLHSRFHPPPDPPSPSPSSPHHPPPPPPNPPSKTHNPNPPFSTRNPPSSSKPTTSPLILEIGTGSGIILAFLTAHARTLFGRPDILTLGLDINPHACVATRKTVERVCEDVRHHTNENGNGEKVKDNGGENRGSGEGGEGVGFLGCINGDLCHGSKQGEVDMLVFNPPYVPTPSVPIPPLLPLPPQEPPNTHPPISTTTTSKSAHAEEEPSDLLSLSYAGGTDGMEVTNRLLAQLPTVLSGGRGGRGGVAYLLLCSRNRPEEVVRRVRGWGDGDGEGGWRCEVVGRSGRGGGWEKLVVIRIWRV